MRHIVPLEDDVAVQYPTNLVVNSRYTPQNFLFKNLYEQFRRPLNFYFLLVSALQFVSVIAPVNPLSTLLPLLFAFALTAVKEGYDDVKRHRQDFAYNNTPRIVLDSATGTWRSCINSDIVVGDVLLLKEGDEIPCDVVVIGATSEVHIRTDNLDGEIDLKRKELVRWRSADAVPGEPSGQQHTLCPLLSDCTSPSAVDVRAAVAGLTLVCPAPTAIVESFDARADILVSSPDATVLPTEAGGRVRTEVHVPLSYRHLLPQSCTLKNARLAVCVAVYTGRETKCGMNKREAPAKWAQVDKDVSRYSIYIFGCQLLNACIFGVLGYGANRSVQDTTWYLQQPANEAAAAAFIYPLRFFLLTTVMIPVSFKFVVDVCKFYMANAVEWDFSMHHPPTDSGRGSADGGGNGHATPDWVGAKVKNSSILEDLGQIDYLLSDKTGTLTQNIMELEAVTVCPGYDVSLSRLAGTGTAGPDTSPQGTDALPSLHRFAKMVALCNDVEVIHAPAIRKAETSGGICPTAGRAHCGEQDSSSVSTSLEYHAASPDEVALCVGMRKLGVTLVSRSSRRAVLHLHWECSRDSVSKEGSATRSSASRPAASTDYEETWIVHHVFQFSSEQKTMGVVVEEPQTGKIWFVVKGADDRIRAMASPSAADAVEAQQKPSEVCETASSFYSDAACAAKLSAYARRGLRTLLVAYKEITHKELTSFLRCVEDAESLTEGRQTALDEVRRRMESGITIVGITAIEDKLQCGVRETINDMLLAGIKVWMITGDKIETAEQIGLSCGLYHPGDIIIRIEDASPSGICGSMLGENGPEIGEGQMEWRRKLLGYSLDQLPPPSSHSPPTSFSTIQRLQAWGASWVAWVRHLYKMHSAWFSNAPLRCISCTETDMAEGTADCSRSLHEAASADGTIGRRAVLVVQGGAVLEAILREPPLHQKFEELAHRCCSVICARTTPSQKAFLAQFIRRRGCMTLAVGDGGNDVAMLQEAHVGVGIAGNEGQQAVRAADVSITRFADLRALLFGHGQLAYTRTAYVIKYSFYKSMLVSFIQLAYNVVGTCASGGTFWNSFSLTMWNGCFTLPQTICYCLDRCAPRVVLERHPYLYKLTRRSVDMAADEFFVSFVMRGVLQSISLLWLSTNTYGLTFAHADGGASASHDVTYTIAYTALIVSQVFTVWWESHSVTPLNLLMLVGMPLLYFYSTMLYSDSPGLQYYGVFRRSLDAAGLLAALGISLSLTVPSLLYFTVLAIRQPNPRDVLRGTEILRQRHLLRFHDYLRLQSLWTRWFGATPEAAPVTSLDELLPTANAAEDPVSVI